MQPHHLKQSADSEGKKAVKETKEENDEWGEADWSSVPGYGLDDLGGRVLNVGQEALCASL